MKSPGKSASPSPAQQRFQLKNLFMGSLGSVPEQHTRTVEKKLLTAWLAEGLIEHRPSEKSYALTPKGEVRIR